MEFRLLTGVNRTEPEGSLVIADRRWVLSKPYDLNDNAVVPPFACLSYVWGPYREPHGFEKGLTMSTRTRPALTAAVRVSDCDAFWTDVFCIPRDEPARQSTLENMGYIYSRASEVLIVLGDDAFTVIEAMIHNKTMSEADLHILERDEWISSVWTYQEVVNGGSVRFVSTNDQGDTASIGCTEFFSTLGASLMQMQKVKNIDTFATVRILPNVSALEEVLADWQTAGYTYRSALRIFSSMSRKRNKNVANYYYAILGAITDTSHELVWDPGQNLAEKVMSICEHKGDYSFIYTIAARESDPKRCWRPRAEFRRDDAASIPPDLRPILAWHCWGDAQEGHYDGEDFWLDYMIVMKPAIQIRDHGIGAISRWLERVTVGLNLDNLGYAVYTAIAGMGFQGNECPIVVEDGFCFTIESLEVDSVARILISSQIRWPMGAPGLVHLEGSRGKRYVPCVFVGEIVEPVGSVESVLL